jgi:hypothetical protein
MLAWFLSVTSSALRKKIEHMECMFTNEALVYCCAACLATADDYLSLFVPTYTSVASPMVTGIYDNTFYVTVLIL